MSVKISISMLSADFLNLKTEIERLEKMDVDMLHLDVMDGIFVPNITFGQDIVKSIKSCTKLPVEVHLMIESPDRYIEQFAKYSDILGFHYEAGSDTLETLKKIKSLGIRSCLTIKPKTNPEEIFEFLPYCDIVLVMSVEPGFGGQSFMESSLHKLEVLKKEIKKQNLNIDLEIDGGINDKTAKLAVKAGTDILVSGSYLFSPDMEDRIKILKNS